MNDLTDALNRHYAPQDVSARILESIRAAGLDPDRLSRDEASMFDEFHGGGRESTRALARDIALAPGTRVLDVGCGIGGPARTLAAEFGCAVTGVDLTADFIHAARKLSLRVGAVLGDDLLARRRIAQERQDVGARVVIVDRREAVIPGQCRRRAAVTSRCHV